jgi:hypothetical protein
MKTTPFFLASIYFSAACGPPAEPDANPPILWMNANGDETHVLLQDSEPRPY